MGDNYWTLGTSLFEGTFRYFGKEPMLVRGKVHTEQEPSSLRPQERDIEPISMLRGIRSYYHMKPFVLIPDIRVTIGRYRQPTLTGQVGEIIESREAPRMKEVEIGQAQAWCYPQDKTIIMWECFYHSFVRDNPLLDDPNMKDPWLCFERFLCERHREAEQIATPAHDPEFQSTEYEAFLTALGYKQVAKAAWGKAVEQEREVAS